MRATAEEKKARALQNLKAARQSVLEAASVVSPESADTVFLGEWSAKDIVAHLTGWDKANADAVRSLLAGELPAFYAHHDRDWRSFNAELVRRYRNENYEAGIRTAMESHRSLCELLESVSAAEYERDRGVRYRGYRVTIARLLEAESSDEQIHARQLRDFQSEA